MTRLDLEFTVLYNGRAVAEAPPSAAVPPIAALGRDRSRPSAGAGPPRLNRIAGKVGIPTGHTVLAARPFITKRRGTSRPHLELSAILGTEELRRGNRFETSGTAV